MKERKSLLQLQEHEVGKGRMLICSGWAMAVISDRNTAAQDVAKQLGITTTTLLYMYVNGDGTVKEPGQKLFDSFSG